MIIYYKPCTITLHIRLKDIQNYKIHIDFGNKGKQKNLKCEYEMNFNVEPYQKNEGKIQNIIGEIMLNSP